MSNLTDIVGNKTYDTRASADIPLAYPIEMDGQKLDKLTMRRAKLGDTVWMRKQAGDDFEKGLKMMARLCNVSPEHIHELDEVDAQAVQEQYESFRPKSDS